MEKSRTKKGLFVVGVILALLIIAAAVFWFRGMISGTQDHIEGKDTEIITNRFTSFSDITECYYVIDVSSGGIGPTTYNMEALVIVDAQESEALSKQYEWKAAQADVDAKLYEGVGIGTINDWQYSDKFSSDTLGGKFVGEVYFSAQNNAIYIKAAQ